MAGALAAEDFIHAGSLSELAANGKAVIRGPRGLILVLHRNGQVYALDNRCPHMGFPLHRGTIEDGILTCHWHHARFDVTSGCTFDLWADDVPRCAVKIEDGEVWVAPEARYADAAGHWRRRLQDGMAHNIGLVVGKAVLGARAAAITEAELVRDAALFGVRHRDGWGTGLTILTALANLLPRLPEEDHYLALYHGIRQVAADSEDAPPWRGSQALRGAAVTPETLRGWFRRWTTVRHRDGAERTVLTAVAEGWTPAELADLLLTAATDRYYADAGHALDFVNKAFECLDLVGWEHAGEILPAVVGQLVAAKGGEELNAWRHPVDLVSLLEDAFAELPRLFAAREGANGPYNGHAELAWRLLAEDPAQVVAALKMAIAHGAGASDLSRALAYAAALRLARFGTANELSDWDTAHHVFTYCSALHRLFARAEAVPASPAGSPEGVRGVFHGAMALYLTRYLNVPPAPLPGEDGRLLDELPTDADSLRAALLEALDRRGQVDEAARLVARYHLLGHPDDGLIATLAAALLREDAGFHAYQNLEAAVRTHDDWGRTDPARHVLIASARFLAARFPTQRARHQTADIARRLMRSERIHEEATDFGQGEA